MVEEEIVRTEGVFRNGKYLPVNRKERTRREVETPVLRDVSLYEERGKGGVVNIWQSANRQDIRGQVGPLGENEKLKDELQRRLAGYEDLLWIDPEERSKWLTRAIDLEQELVATFPSDAHYKIEIASTLTQLAEDEAEKQRTEEARQFLEQALTNQRAAPFIPVVLRS